jgi:hypothetical protein
VSKTGGVHRVMRDGYLWLSHDEELWYEVHWLFSIRQASAFYQIVRPLIGGSDGGPLQAVEFRGYASDPFLFATEGGAIAACRRHAKLVSSGHTPLEATIDLTVHRNQKRERDRRKRKEQNNRKEAVRR